MSFRAPDSLYSLLPYVYRQKDAERGYPLQALLRVIGEQVAVIEDDIDRLYDNWFIETCDDWVVPYIGDLIGYTPVPEAGTPGDDSPRATQRSRAIVPRREVASTLALRRRKGSLALLEVLSHDVTGWPARAVEFHRFVGATQSIRHLRPERGRTVDLRDGDALERLDGPFDEIARTVDVHRVSARSGGRYNLPSVGLFVWRLRSFPVTRAPAYRHEAAGKSVGQAYFTFSILGNDAPLFTKPQREEDPTGIAGPLNVPGPITRRALERDLAQPEPTLYGEGKSFAVWIDAPDPECEDQIKPVLVPASRIVAADLSRWHYRAGPGQVAVDPELGRLALPAGEQSKGVRVSYHDGAPAAIGGGEYERPMPEPPGEVPHDGATPEPPGKPRRDEATREPGHLRFYEVGRGCPFESLADALGCWEREQPWTAIVEIADSDVYGDVPNVALLPGQHLTIRAANRARPVLRLVDREAGEDDSMLIRGEEGSSLTLDGLMIMGRGLTIRGPLERVAIRHTTLVPGWDLLAESRRKRPYPPSLLLQDVTGRILISKSILGPIGMDTRGEPITMEIADSVLDAGGPEHFALSGPDDGFARAALDLRRITVFGRVAAHAITLAENSIFEGLVQVARRQQGGMRYSYVPETSRTPRRHRCQPDLSIEATGEAVRPVWESTQYGSPAYAQLADECPEEIRRGADDEGEMGAHHDLFAPQREANLRARLEEYTPAGSDAGVLFVT